MGQGSTIIPLSGLKFRYVIEVPLAKAEAFEEAASSFGGELISRSSPAGDGVAFARSVRVMRRLSAPAADSAEVTQLGTRRQHQHRRPRRADGRWHRVCSDEEIIKVFKARGTQEEIAERFQLSQETVRKIKGALTGHHRRALVRAGVIKGTALSETA